MRCKLIPPEYRECTNDYELLTLSGLNDYLNGYTEKLSRANTREPSQIHIDCMNFSELLK